MLADVLLRPLMNRSDIPCNLCGATNGRIFIDTDLSTFATNLDAPVRYAVCSRCSFISSCVPYEDVVSGYKSDAPANFREYYQQEMMESASAAIHIRKSWPAFLEGAERRMLDIRS